MGLGAAKGSHFHERLHRESPQGARPLNAHSHKQYSPHPHTLPKYGAAQQFAADSDKTPVLDKNGKQYVQRVTGKFLYLARGVDPASKQAAPTEDTTLKKV